jgi:cation transport regulator ChaC
MYIDLRTPTTDFRLYLEIDRGTENKPKIKAKLERYWRAFRTTWRADGEQTAGAVYRAGQPAVAD